MSSQSSVRRFVTHPFDTEKPRLLSALTRCRQLKRDLLNAVPGSDQSAARALNRVSAPQWAALSPRGARESN